MKKTSFLSLIGLLICSTAFAQSPNEIYSKDVKSIEAIINAYYEVISGSSDDPWQFKRDKFLHSENAVIIRLDDSGKAEAHSLEAEYIPVGLKPREAFYEHELKRAVSRYGNMAQVWSAFEIRTDPEYSSDVRGLNSIQLHYEDGRWYIDSWTAQMESEHNSIVQDFLNEY